MTFNPSHKSCQNVWPNVGKERNPEKGKNVPNDWSQAMLLSSHPTHSPLFLPPLSIVVCHGSRAPAQRTGVVIPQHVVHQTMHENHHGHMMVFVHTIVCRQMGHCSAAWKAEGGQS
ncbi:hypothetical protein NPIL_350271 [Nephila pilipes]|uniref:Uncharacterized protein n=1 Tax=Nephila pilipes TaxID=299642 RepID=A0A8X6US02_NEPPI|nr:hypothetical protein NPIL_350271 [Nephila pilipes]